MKKLLTSIAAAGIVLAGTAGTAGIATAAPIAPTYNEDPVCQSEGWQKMKENPEAVVYGFAGSLKVIYYGLHGCHV